MYSLFTFDFIQTYFLIWRSGLMWAIVPKENCMWFIEEYLPGTL